MVQTKHTTAHLTAVLNDLLKLDHDAIGAYNLAIQAAKDPLHRETLEVFRGDHERHIQDLTRLIEAHGGVPIRMTHIPTGQFKLAVQAIGNLGDDRSVLMAFKANERQVRDKYLRASEEDLPPEVAEVVARNAADEVKHYAWASEAMEVLGAGEETLVGRAEKAFETVHARTADAIEAADRRLIEGAERVRRRVHSVTQGTGSSRSILDEVRRFVRRSPGASLALAVLAGLVVRRILR